MRTSPDSQLRHRLLRIVLAASCATSLAACDDSRAPGDPASPAGGDQSFEIREGSTFDVLSGPGRLAVVIRAPNRLEIQRISVHWHMRLSGSSPANGRWQLEGSELAGDVLSPVTATATVLDGDSGVRIEVTPEAPYEPFVLFRPHAADVDASFGGRYVVSFAQSPSGCPVATAGVLTVELQPTGTGIARSIRDVSASGKWYGTTTAGECLVSPRGALHIAQTYAFARGSGACYACGDRATVPLLLSGRLERRGGFVSGGGTFNTDLVPACSGPGGEWIISEL